MLKGLQDLVVVSENETKTTANTSFEARERKALEALRTGRQTLADAPDGFA